MNKKLNIGVYVAIAVFLLFMPYWAIVQTSTGQDPPLLIVTPSLSDTNVRFWRLFDTIDPTTSSGQYLGAMDVGAPTWNLDVTRSGGFAAAHRELGSISVWNGPGSNPSIVDLRTQSTPDPDPFDVIVDWYNESSSLSVSDANNGAVHAISGEELLRTTPVGENAAFMEFDPTSDRLFVSDEEGDKIVSFDVRRDPVTNDIDDLAFFNSISFPPGSRPAGMALRRGDLYAGGFDSAKVYVIDAEIFTLKDTISVAPNPMRVVAPEGNDHVFVSHFLEENNVISCINIDSHEVEEIPIAPLATGFECSLDGRNCFLSHLDGRVTRFEPLAKTVKSVFNFGGNPFDIGVVDFPEGFEVPLKALDFQFTNLNITNLTAANRVNGAFSWHTIDVNPQENLSGNNFIWRKDGYGTPQHATNSWVAACGSQAFPGNSCDSPIFPDPATGYNSIFVVQAFNESGNLSIGGLNVTDNPDDVQFFDITIQPSNAVPIAGDEVTYTGSATVPANEILQTRFFSRNGSAGPWEEICPLATADRVTGDVFEASCTFTTDVPGNFTIVIHGFTGSSDVVGVVPAVIGMNQVYLPVINRNN